MHFLLEWCITQINSIKAILVGVMGDIGLLKTAIANISPGTGAVQVYQFTANPNTEAITPANIALPAIAYPAGGVGDWYSWNTTGHIWQ